MYVCICVCTHICICISPASFPTGYGLIERDLSPFTVTICLKFLIYLIRIQKLYRYEFLCQAGVNKDFLGI